MGKNLFFLNKKSVVNQESRKASSPSSSRVSSSYVSSYYENQKSASTKTMSGSEGEYDETLEDDECELDGDAECRDTADILKDLCGYQPAEANAMDRLPHDCYMIWIGRLRTQQDMNKLKRMNESQGITSTKESDENQAEYAVMKSEELETMLEYITLEGSTEQLERQRRNHLVYEDNFNTSLFNMLESGSSYNKLKTVCRKYETKEGVDVNKVMAAHEQRVDKSSSYFTKRGLSQDEANALAFSISFYTGAKSEACNRSASLIARKGNSQVIEPRTEEDIKEAAIILYYLVKALSYIPFYWGYVTRACQLTFDELQIYRPGCLITWIQFSSSKKGKKVMHSKAFKNRNVLFKIYSLTGRPIREFSNYAEEDEVLFLPHSTFLVFNRKTFYKARKHVIYMRQVELGLCQWSVLWVDDNIFDEGWENKRHMEYAAVKALDMNVHFIPKSNTETALSFLRSPFGQRLKNQRTFRIVTDMNRENERPVHNAGARLIKAVRQMGFQNECLVFTSDKRKAEETLASFLNSKEQQCIKVSQVTEDLRNFVNFDQKPTKAQQYFSEHPTKPKNNTNLSTPKKNTSQGYATASNDQQYFSYIDTDNGMMHNDMNTNIDIITDNCMSRNLSNSRHNCVLLTTGSFNPVHPSHFRNLLLVKQYLENEYQPSLNVLAGYISPTHDAYVRRKLGDLAWIPAKDRCQLCQKALHEWPDGFVDFPDITENFRDFLNATLVEKINLLQHPLRVVYVCGLDHFNKCPDVQRMAKKNNISCAVIFRIGYDEEQINYNNQTSNVFYIPLKKERNKLAEVSSTQIRQYFQNPAACTTNIEKYIYPHVRDYMVKKYRKK